MTTAAYSVRASRKGRLALPLVLGLTIGAAVLPLRSGRTLAAQGQTPCALLTSEEIQQLAPKNETIAAGVPSGVQAIDSFSCRYSWGAGNETFRLDVNVNPASRVYPGMNGDSIKMTLLSLVIPGTIDAAIPEVGQAAVFKSYSPAYASASAYIKDRILQMNLDGIDAPERKGQLVALLKSAAARL